MGQGQTLNEGRWRIHLDGFPDLTTDELTLDDIETVEKVCSVPWVLINPLASAKEAKGLLAVLLIRGGIPEAEALKAAGKTTLHKLAGAFRYELPDRVPASTGHQLTADEGEPDPPL